MTLYIHDFFYCCHALGAYITLFFHLMFMVFLSLHNTYCVNVKSGILHMRIIAIVFQFPLHFDKLTITISWTSWPYYGRGRVILCRLRWYVVTLRSNYVNNNSQCFLLWGKTGTWNNYFALIHIEHLYSASSRELLNKVPLSSD